MHEKCVLDKVALGQILLRVLLFFFVSIILQMLSTLFHLHVTFPEEKKKGEAWKTSEIEYRGIEKYFHIKFFFKIVVQVCESSKKLN